MTSGTPVSLAAISQLLGDENLAQLKASRVMVVGLGGVGSWSVEMLARSGVGKLILVDADEVCESNINRQIMATYRTIGRSKAELLAERARDINPSIEVIVKQEFCTESNIEELLDLHPTVIIDAIDGVANKSLLIDSAKKKNIPLICTGGAAGKRDISQIFHGDLAQTVHDPLLQRIRKKLRNKFEFTRKKMQPFGVTTVYSKEFPHVASSCETEGNACEQKMGSLATITACMGIHAAHLAIETIIQLSSRE